MSEAQQPAPAPADRRTYVVDAPERREGAGDPEPAPDRRTYVVDRIEAGVATLVADEEPVSGASGDVEVRVEELPFQVAEGDVLHVPTRPDGILVWGAAATDPAARARRLAQAEERLARLRKRDPGGDVVL